MISPFWFTKPELVFYMYGGVTNQLTTSRPEHGVKRLFTYPINIMATFTFYNPAEDALLPSTLETLLIDQPFTTDEIAECFGPTDPDFFYE